MPQRSQHCLVHVLLFWVAVLSIMQVVFIIFFFTFFRQHNIATAPKSTAQFQSNNTPPSSTEQGLLLGKGQMLTFQTSDGTTLKWLPKNPDSSLVLKGEGDRLKVKKDGYYFLNLQLALCSCAKEHKVKLMWEDKVLLQSSVNNNKSCSTGPMSKVEELHAGGTLRVTIDPTPSDIKQGHEICINTDEPETHLDVIYMVKP